MISQNSLVYQRIYSIHISHLSFSSLYLSLLVSGIRKKALKYMLLQTNFHFEISRVDCISKQNFYSHFSINIHVNHLKHPPLPPLFSARKKLSVRPTPMHLNYKSRNILFPSIQLIIHPLIHGDHLTRGLL